MSKKHSKHKKMFGASVIFVFSAIFAYCESAALVANLKKCKLGQDECQLEFYRSVFREIPAEGIPEMGIPAVDPYVLKNLNFVIMGMMNLTIVDGFAKGFKSCTSNKHHTDPEKLVTSIELVCELYDIETMYQLHSTPTLEALIGGIKIHGEGKGGVIIEKIQLNIEIPFEIKKLEDCEPHFVIINDRVTYTHDILGKIVFSGDNLYVGSQELSTPITIIMNENWEFFSKNFARSIMDVVVDATMSHFNKLFASIPVNDFITDDVTSLISV